MQQILDWILNLDPNLTEQLIIVLILGIMHPIISQPASIVSISLAIIFFGFPLGIPYLFLTYLIGIVIYYFLIKTLNKKYQFHKRPKMKPAFEWLESTPGYKHSIALGLPLVPTYVIKLALPMSEKSFIDYLKIMIGSYLLLMTCYISLYYGVLVVLLTGEISYLTGFILIIFVLFMYFASTVRKKWMNPQSKE